MNNKKATSLNNSDKTPAKSAIPSTVDSTASATIASLPPTVTAAPAVATLPKHAAGELLVQFLEGTNATGRVKALSAVGGTVLETISSGEASDSALLLRVKFGGSLPTTKAIEALSKQPGVKFAEPNFTVTTQATSNDPYFTGGNQWDMRDDGSTLFGSRADKAWNAELTGSMKTVVGVIDSGVDYRHADLYLNIWLNQREIPTTLRAALTETDGDGLITFRDLNNVANKAYVADLNSNGYIDGGDLLKDTRWADGVDADGNGYSDDLIGWDFANNDNDPLDDNNHGTHVSGTIGAAGGNGVGIAGVNWSTQLMALKFISSSGSGSQSNAIKALDYYTAHSKTASTGVDFVGTNNSWGGGSFTQSLQDAIVRTGSAGNLFIAAAGNGGSDGVGDNNDVIASYPSNYSTQAALGWESVVAVAALTATGSLASFSNYGDSTVDIAAPGAGIWSTLPNGGYGSMSGTSMAAPHVMGALALIASAMPNASPQQLLDKLKQSVTAKTDLASNLAWDGWLDLSKLASLVGVVVPPPIGTPQTIYGTDGNDLLTGSSDNDVISGVPLNSTRYGRGSVDVLTGGSGNDVFVLGANGRIFYDDGNTKTAGTTDYVRINDFVSGQDDLQLMAGKSYVAAITTMNGASGLAIYWDVNANRKLEIKTDEMIAFLTGVRTLSDSDIIYSA